MTRDQKSDDINKIRLIHDIKNKFIVDDEMIRALTSQIQSTEFSSQIDRFYRGYTYEDHFHVLFGVLPWVKLLHTLGQHQIPGQSKEKFQVPDFQLFFQTTKTASKPMLVETKSVKGDAQSLEVMGDQLSICRAYSTLVNIPLVYAIYWEKYQSWTMNAIENFALKKNNYRIHLFEALKNDLSIIAGDIMFLIKGSLYRKTVADRRVVDSVKPVHEKYGTIMQDSISIDGNTYLEITPLETAIIDTTFKMKKIKVSTEGDLTTLIELSDQSFFVKLSTLVLRHLAIFQADLTEEFADMSMRIIIEFLKKIKAVDSYSVPTIKTDTSDTLYQQAFEGSWVWKHYHEKDA